MVNFGHRGGKENGSKKLNKKRLIELGVSEEHAHKLADDANMDAIKRMTVEEVAKKVGLESGASELENIMGIIREQGLLLGEGADQEGLLFPEQLFLTRTSHLGKIDSTF